MWERGLKLSSRGMGLITPVAPHVGAWIETQLAEEEGMKKGVAPHVGAWIETSCHNNKKNREPSLPMWERGLKPCGATIGVQSCLSLPMWERGLKLDLHALLNVGS